MKKENEEHACDAFINIMNRIAGRHYARESSPEEENRKSPDVEYILISRAGHSHRIAVEHTIVESFTNQKAYAIHSYEIVEEINDQCKERLPLDHCYFLIIPPALSRSLKKGRKRQFVRGASSWVINVAKTMRTDQWSSWIYDNHKVTLMCDCSYPDAESNGRVFRLLTSPEETEKLQRERFRTAIREKASKLCKYKLKGFGTALLLEDICMSGGLYDHKARWKDLTRTQKDLVCKFVDYVVILFSNDQKMIAGRMWKEEARRPYSEIPQDRKFSFR